MNFAALKNWWWLLGLVNVPVLIALLSIGYAIWNDPEFYQELFTEVLTRENVKRFSEMALKVDYLWVEAGGDMRE